MRRTTQDTHPTADYVGAAVGAALFVVPPVAAVADLLGLIDWGLGLLPLWVGLLVLTWAGATMMGAHAPP